MLRSASISRNKSTSVIVRQILRRSHLLNHRIPKLAALHFLGAFHLSGEVLGDVLGVDGAVHALEDAVGGFDPAEVAQHHFAVVSSRACSTS